MALVFREAFCRFGRLGGEQASTKADGGCGIAAELGRAHGEYKPEEVRGVGGEYRICLGARDVGDTRDFGDTPEVVAEIGVERTEALIHRHRHWREELYAVAFSFGAQAHHAIVQAVGTLSR